MSDTEAEPSSCKSRSPEREDDPVRQAPREREGSGRLHDEATAAEQSALVSVFRYVKWLRQFAIGYQLYGGMVEAKKKNEAAGRGAAEGKIAASCRGKELDGRLSGAPSVGDFVSTTKPANSMECQASIEDVLILPKVLLDSGSDETLVSEGLLVALERLGASLNVETKPRLMFKLYGETTKPLHVTRQVQFKTVTLETSIGPLVLRGL
ncbi:hypothetical protein DYB31_010740 [Aphanomyces astaci]|uniref:Peptidase A2 domain-containing protein n=1 Tax=Aphanomyces astaci TaxID=112090 RepID=A0A397EMW6_APHAT|nr:hypothetical protein DYB31_010740 [Aphanomyces astaci]